MFGVLAAIAILTGIMMLATGQWLYFIACLVCAVVFGLEARGISTLGRTRRALERLRQERRS